MSRATFVSKNIKHKVNALRMEEYKKATGFSVDLLTLEWQHSDDMSFVMALESENKIVATMRGEVITNLDLLEKKLECPWSFPLDICFPVLLLSRAATDSTFRTKGLNLVQRYWFLKLAEHFQIPFVLGTFVSGSPRENTLRDMGYQFFHNELGWQQSTYKSLRPVTVVALDMKKNGKQALSHCEVHAPIADFPLEEEFPELKIVETI